MVELETALFSYGEVQTIDSITLGGVRKPSLTYLVHFNESVHNHWREEPWP